MVKRPTQRQHAFSGVSYRKILKVWKADVQVRPNFFDNGHTFMGMDCFLGYSSTWDWEMGGSSEIKTKIIEVLHVVRAPEFKEDCQIIK